MNGRIAKKLRREIRRSETYLAKRASTDFKRFVMMLPWWGRVLVAWKIIRKAL